MVAACNNPANLKTGKGKPDSYFLAQGFLNGSGGATQPAWANPSPSLDAVRENARPRLHALRDEAATSAISRCT